MASDPGRDRRGAALFFGGLVVVVLALGVAGALASRQRVPAEPVASVPQAPGPDGARVLGPRDPNEPLPSAKFTLHGVRSGYEKSFYVLGQVENSSPFAIDKPRVVVTLKDAAGAALGAREGYAERDRLEPGETSPVKVLVSEPPPHASLAYEVIARRALFDPGKVEGLEVEFDGPPRQNFNTWEISGKVTNHGKVGASLTRIELVARNAAGKIIGVESAFADDQLLEPEKTSRFRANVMLDEKPEKVEPAAFARPAH